MSQRDTLRYGRLQGLERLEEALEAGPPESMEEVRAALAELLEFVGMLGKRQEALELRLEVHEFDDCAHSPRVS